MYFKKIKDKHVMSGITESFSVNARRKASFENLVLLSDSKLKVSKILSNQYSLKPTLSLTHMLLLVRL